MHHYPFCQRVFIRNSKAQVNNKTAAGEAELGKTERTTQKNTYVFYAFRKRVLFLNKLLQVATGFQPNLVKVCTKYLSLISLVILR